MKKFVSMICAVALAAVCAVSAFAAGTPGEVARELITKEEWTAADVETFKDVVKTIDGATVIDKDMVTAFASARSVALKDSSYTSVGNVADLPGQEENNAVISTMSEDPTAKIVNMTFAPVEGKPDTYTLSADFVKADGVTPATSSLGFLVSLSVDATDSDSYQLLYTNADGSTTTIDTYTYIYRSGAKKVAYIQAWVPHFSTYTLVGNKKAAPAATATPAPVATPAPTATPAATVAPAPAAAPAAAPIKATGADMSAAALVVALGIAASVGGAAYLTKKNGLGK